jgi:hypothetical protein
MIEFAMLSLASLWTWMFGGTTQFTSTTQSIVPVQGNNFGYVVSSYPSVASTSYANTQYGYQIKSVQGTGGIAYSPTTTIPSYMPTYASGVEYVQPYGTGYYAAVPYTVKYVSTQTSTGYIAVQAK